MRVDAFLVLVPLVARWCIPPLCRYSAIPSRRSPTHCSRTSPRGVRCFSTHPPFPLHFRSGIALDPAPPVRIQHRGPTAVDDTRRRTTMPAIRAPLDFPPSSPSLPHPAGPPRSPGHPRRWVLTLSPSVPHSPFRHPRSSLFAAGRAPSGFTCVVSLRCLLRAARTVPHPFLVIPSLGIRFFHLGPTIPGDSSPPSLPAPSRF